MTGRIVFASFIALMVLVGIVGAISRWYKSYQQEQERIQVEINTATAAVTELADELHSKQEDNRYLQEELNATDPWGNKYQASYTNQSTFGIQESLEVRSYGPDGERGTSDDIFVTRELPTAQGELSGAARKTAGWAWKKITGSDDGKKESEQ